MTRFLALIAFAALTACAAAPASDALYEAEAQADERTLRLEVLSGETDGSCPRVLMQERGGEWQRTGEMRFDRSLAREVMAPDCSCAFDQDEPFVPEKHFDLTEAKAACDQARSGSAAG